MGQQDLHPEWSIRELGEYIDLVLATKATRGVIVFPQPLPPPLIKCRFCQREFDVADITNPNICLSCSGVLLELAAEARRASRVEELPKTE